MAMYLMRVTYNASAYQGMLSAPSDRGAAAKALIAALGIKCHEMLYSISSGSTIMVVEATAEQMTEAGMIVMASGAIDSVISEELVSMETMNAVMHTAAAKSANYKSPIKK